jgi:hypothetical protein
VQVGPPRQGGPTRTEPDTAGRLYKELGGKVTVIVQEGVGHFPTGPKDPKPVVEWILNPQPGKAAEPKPARRVVLPAGG